MPCVIGEILPDGGSCSSGSRSIILEARMTSTDLITQYPSLLIIPESLGGFASGADFYSSGGKPAKYFDKFYLRVIQTVKVSSKKRSFVSTTLDGVIFPALQETVSKTGIPEKTKKIEPSIFELEQLCFK
jgi:hypothetical protein